MPNGFPGNDVFIGRIPHFFSLLGELPTGIPIQSQWVLVIHDFPKRLMGQVQQFESYQNVDHSTSWNNVKLFIDYETAAPLQTTKGCVFAQKINSPSDGIEYSRAAGANYTGGYVKGPITTARKDFSTFDVSFLETNLSFADMVLRPWVIMASHQGLVARENRLLNSRPWAESPDIKSNMSVYHLAKAGPGKQLIVRKIFNYYDCVPVSIDSEEYTYISDEMHLRNVSILYSYYTSDADSVMTGQPKGELGPPTPLLL